VLTRLEFKVFNEDRSLGLNLTRATLDAVIKYPWARPAAGGKFNVYDDDMQVFDWVRDASPTGVRCFEAQVMDFADDVAYCVHDLEDAIVSGAFDPAAISRSDVRTDVVGSAHAEYARDLDPSMLHDAVQRVAALPFWPHSFDHSGRSSAALKHMTSSLIRRFCSTAQRSTREQFPQGGLQRYGADLVVPGSVLAEVAVLKAITYNHVMRDNEQRYAWEQRVISDVVHGLLEGRRPLQRPYQLAWEATDDPVRRLRLVIDQVASLTDLSVLRWREEMAR
jgi:dGTPase